MKKQAEAKPAAVNPQPWMVTRIALAALAPAAWMIDTAVNLLCWRVFFDGLCDLFS